MKPQTKKVVKAQKILAQAKKKKKIVEQKKVKKKNDEETKKVKKKELDENKKGKICADVKTEKPTVPKKDATPSKPKPVPRQFLLPALRSRSSRKITPVRFFDDECFPNGGSKSRVRNYKEY